MAGKRLDEMTISASMGMGAGAIKQCVISVTLRQEGKGEPGITAKIRVIDVDTGEIVSSDDFTYAGTSSEAAGQLALDKAYYLAQEAGFGHVREVYANYETISDY